MSVLISKVLIALSFLQKFDLGRIQLDDNRLDTKITRHFCYPRVPLKKVRSLAVGEHDHHAHVSDANPVVLFCLLRKHFEYVANNLVLLGRFQWAVMRVDLPEKHRTVMLAVAVEFHQARFVGDPLWL